MLENPCVADKEFFTDDDILSMQRVTVAIAAKYLRMPINQVRHGLETERLPFGMCFLGDRRTYHINPALLVKYRNGELAINPTPGGYIPKQQNTDSKYSKCVVECDHSDLIASATGGNKKMRNQNGSGTIKKWGGNRRKPFGAFAPAYYDENGNYKQTLLGSYATEDEARKALLMFAYSDWAEPSAITLEEIFDEWKINAYKIISKSTQNGYNAAWKRLAPIRNTKVVDIKARHLQSCIDMADNQGCSRSALHQIKVLAGLLEKYARENDIIHKNYAEFIKLPKKSSAEKEIFSDEQILKIKKAADEGYGLADVIMIMICTGWRINELLDLRHEDYDPINQTLTGGLKTDAGMNRVVTVPDIVMPYLQKWLDKDENYIICSSRKGCRMKDKTLRAEFKRTLGELGITPKNSDGFLPHATRHTYISLLNRFGVDTKTIMELAGHSDVKTSIGTYTHTDLTQKKVASEKFNSLEDAIKVKCE